MLRSKNTGLSGRFEGDRYTNQDFGISLNKPPAWDLSEEKSFFYDKIVLRAGGGTDKIFIIKTKLPVLEQSNDLSRDLFVRLHVQVIKKVLKRVSRGCESIIEQPDAELLGKKAYLVRAVHVDGPSRYQTNNFLLKHRGKVYGVGYKVKEEPDCSETMLEMKSIIDSIQFLER